MGMDLIGPNRWFYWNISSWQTILDVGIRHGWVPMGTGARHHTLKHDWQGSYFGNGGQIVYAKDSRNLADALEAFLAKKPSKKILKEGTDDWIFSREGRKAIREFIAFCRKGNFRIY